MKMKKTLSTMTILLSTLALNANAELIESDLNNFGDNLAAFDTISGLEWLDLSLTQRMSVNSVYAELGTGGAFEGWRIPTHDEIKALIFNNILDAPAYETWTSGYNYTTLPSSTYSSNMVEKMGGHYGSYLLDENTSTFSGIYPTLAYAYFNRNKFSPDSSVSYFGKYAGVYLVSDGGDTYSSIKDPTMGGYRAEASVPLTASLGLMTIGLLSLRRKKV